MGNQGGAKGDREDALTPNRVAAMGMGRCRCKCGPFGRLGVMKMKGFQTLFKYQSKNS